MPQKDIPQTEQQARFRNVVGFLKNAEQKYPALTQQLPNLLSGMLGGQSFDPELMVQNEGYISGGLAYLGSWLNEAGFHGFKVDGLSLADKAVKAGAPLKVKLPTREGFFAHSNIALEHHQELHNAMVDLSKTIGGALEVGYKPKQIVAALFIQSTAAIGDERAETSLPTREMLIKASGNKLAGVNRVLNKWVQEK